ncbi:hypothetical protein [Nostoc commune]|nr:hypothetical protein [Nostoc commune]
MKPQNFRKSADLFSAICGGLLISLPAIPQALAQESTLKVNPCPSIFYEEPHNSQVVVPQGCPPNALTQRLAAQGLLPVPATPSQEQIRFGVGGEADPANISSTLNPSPSIFTEPPYNRSQAPVPPQPGARPPRPVPPTEGQMSPVPPQPGARSPRPVPPTEGQMSPVPPQPGVRPPRPVPPTEGQMSPVPPQPGVRPPRPVPPTEGQMSPVPPQPVPGDRSQQPSPGAVSTDQPSVLQPRQTPSATIALNNGTVNIRLVNDTAANVTYQVIGDTAPRSLQGKYNVTLQGLRTPLTVTFEREDGGQLIVTPQASSEAGTLEVTFKEATNTAQGRSAMRIEPNGSVFLN